MYEYSMEVLRVVDGDTVHGRVDLGMDVRLDVTLRFAGINAPEVSTAEGRAARAYVVNALPVGQSFVIRTAKDRREKYGRYLAWVQLADGTWLNEVLVTAGQAVPYLDLPTFPPGG